MTDGSLVWRDGLTVLIAAVGCKAAQSIYYLLFSMFLPLFYNSFSCPGHVQPDSSFKTSVQFRNLLLRALVCEK